MAHSMVARVATRRSCIAIALGMVVSGCSADGDADTTRRSRVSAIQRAPTPVTAGQGGSAPINAGGSAPLSGGGPQQPTQSGTTTTTPTLGVGRDTACEVARLAADRHIPEMMIVLDRSGSMQDEGRWEPSASAVRRITEELQGDVDFALTLFPDPANQEQRGRDNACNRGVTVIPVASDNATDIAGVLNMTLPRGGTPTSDTLELLLETYAAGAQEVDPDARPRLQYVLLVTDGQPTCPAGEGRDTTPADVNASNAAIEALAMANVKTYVIGYDTTSVGNEELAAVLDGFAMRGNTGDMQHRPVEDEATLVEELRSIAGVITSCSLDLDQAPADPAYVLVKLDGSKLSLDDVNGWMMVGDRTIELSGMACEVFKEGSHLIEVTGECAPPG